MPPHKMQGRTYLVLVAIWPVSSFIAWFFLPSSAIAQTKPSKLQTTPAKDTLQPLASKLKKSDPSKKKSASNKIKNAIQLRSSGFNFGSRPDGFGRAPGQSTGQFGAEYLGHKSGNATKSAESQSRKPNDTKPSPTNTPSTALPGE